VEVKGNVYIVRVFSGDAPTLPALLDPALQSLVSGSPLSQAALAIGYEQFSSSSSSPSAVALGVHLSVHCVSFE